MPFFNTPQPIFPAPPALPPGLGDFLTVKGEGKLESEAAERILGFLVRVGFLSGQVAGMLFLETAGAGEEAAIAAMTEYNNQLAAGFRRQRGGVWQRMESTDP